MCWCADGSRVAGYIDQLENFDAKDIALICEVKDLDRAKTYASQVHKKSVWSKLGKAQLDEKLPADAIESYINAEDPSEYVIVCSVANEGEIYTKLIP